MAEERGYTRTPINVGGLHPYHDIYPALPDGYADPSLFDSLVSRLQRHNLTPLIFVLDDTRGPDPSYTFKMLDHFRSSGCEFAVGWEMNGWLSPPQMYDAVEAISHELNQKVWVHFTPNHAAIDSPEAASWHKIQPFVHGILFQGNQNDSPEDVGARLEDFTLRLQTGYNGWPHPLKVIAFELQAYNKFHHGWSEAQGRDFTRKVIANMSHKPDGFCDGGYI